MLEKLTYIVGAISLAVCGLILAGSALFPEQGEKYKEIASDVLLAMIPGIAAAIMFAIGRAMK